MPRFSDWQVLNAQVLLQSQVEQDPLTQELKVSFRLWDIFSNTQMAAKKITAKTDSWRKLAHIVADSIYERLTGDKGYFDSKIVFVSESGKGKYRQKGFGGKIGSFHLCRTAGFKRGGSPLLRIKKRAGHKHHA